MILQVEPLPTACSAPGSPAAFSVCLRTHTKPAPGRPGPRRYLARRGAPAGAAARTPEERRRATAPGRPVPGRLAGRPTAIAPRAAARAAASRGQRAQRGTVGAGWGRGAEAAEAAGRGAAARGWAGPGEREPFVPAAPWRPPCGPAGVPSCSSCRARAARYRTGSRCPRPRSTSRWGRRPSSAPPSSRARAPPPPAPLSSAPASSSARLPPPRPPPPAAWAGPGPPSAPCRRPDAAAARADGRGAPGPATGPPAPFRGGNGLRLPPRGDAGSREPRPVALSGPHRARSGGSEPFRSPNFLHLFAFLCQAHGRLTLRGRCTQHPLAPPRGPPVISGS